MCGREFRRGESARQTGGPKETMNGTHSRTRKGQPQTTYSAGREEADMRRETNITEL